MKRSLLSMLPLLIVALAAVAQPRISLNKETHNFGQIEWKRPVTVRYTIANTGNQPLVLTNVIALCACAVANWTKGPIAPGGKGVIKASFDAKALGYLEKSIGVYSDASSSLVYLKLAGGVVQEIKGYAKLLPYTIGNVRPDRNEFVLPDVYRGQQPSLTFNIANPSDRPYELVLMHLPPYLEVEAEPKVLLKGKEGTIKLTLDASQLKDYGLTRTPVYLSRFSGDEVSEDNEIPVSATLLLDFSRMAEKDSLGAPAIHASETDIDLSIPSVKRNKVSHGILVVNSGKIPLVTSELQVFNSSVGVNLKKTVLPPSRITKLEVTVRKRDVDNKKHHLRILTTTSGPLHPKVEISIRR